MAVSSFISQDPVRRRRTNLLSEGVKSEECRNELSVGVSKKQQNGEASAFGQCEAAEASGSKDKLGVCVGASEKREKKPKMRPLVWGERKSVCEKG